MTSANGEATGQQQQQPAVRITVTVRHGTQSLQVEVARSGNVSDLMADLERRTKVPPRGQKLIHKGKVLTGEQSLESAKIVNGSKIMLMASVGIHGGGTVGHTGTPYQRAGAAVSSKEGNLGVHTPRGSARAVSLAPPPVALSQEKARQEAWIKTGIVSLRQSSLQAVPGAVWAVGTALRVLDLGDNALRSFPSSVANLVNLQKLRLSSNALTQSSIAWEALVQLPHLTALALDHNQISALPPVVGRFRSLKRLALGHNTMSSLPSEIGQISNLEWIDAAHNRLAAIPSSLSQCSMLTEINFSANFVGSIPPLLGCLTRLKVLLLNNNALKTVPSEVLRGCSELSTLSLHGNQITVDQLRQIEGWAEFDERRRAKYNKQLEFHALGSSNGFDEGADAHMWHRW